MQYRPLYNQEGEGRQSTAQTYTQKKLSPQVPNVQRMRTSPTPHGVRPHAQRTRPHFTSQHWLLSHMKLYKIGFEFTKYPRLLAPGSSSHPAFSALVSGGVSPVVSRANYEHHYKADLLNLNTR